MNRKPLLTSPKGRNKIKNKNERNNKYAQSKKSPLRGDSEGLIK
jgi:hypothetical protein